MDAIINILVEFRDVIWVWLEPNLVWFQLASVLLSGLILWGIIYIVTKVDYFGMKAEEYMNILGRGNITKRRSLKGWEQIRRRISGTEQQDWKLAVLEADTILNEVLKMAGYLGTDLAKKLEVLTPENLPSLIEIKKAHDVAAKILRDPATELKREDAIATLKIYKKAFIELNLLEE